MCDVVRLDSVFEGLFILLFLILLEFDRFCFHQTVLFKRCLVFIFRFDAVLDKKVDSFWRGLIENGLHCVTGFV